ncbi:MAG: leucine dehydrogenase [Legionellales bacterium]|nr:leucine dehydrogenase [Legionellales bacterium]
MAKYRYGALMRYANMLGFGQIHTKLDHETGLHALIAIHNIELGPAIGGCRCFTYESTTSATKDVLRLAYMMTLKAAISGLPHGGAKAVIIRPKKIKDRRAFFHSFGDFVHQMNGHYITACDVGTSPEEMNIIAERTPYVIGATSLSSYQSNPAEHTARGVLRGIQAAVKHRLHHDDISGLRVSIQGLGNVGYDLARLLHDRGAIITATDPNSDKIQQAVDELGIQAVSLDGIYDIPSDIFSPCALGGTLNLNTLNRINTSIIAGSANNQLAHKKYIHLIQQKNILYAPDYLINAGGLINAAIVYDYQDPPRATQQIDDIYDITLELFERAEKEQATTIDIAEKMARERIEKGKTLNRSMTLQSARSNNDPQKTSS